MNKEACSVEPARLEGYTNSTGQDTIYLSAIDKDANIVSLIQSNYSDFGSGVVAPGTGFILHNRGALFTLGEAHRYEQGSMQRRTGAPGGLHELHRPGHDLLERDR